MILRYSLIIVRVEKRLIRLEHECGSIAINRY